MMSTMARKPDTRKDTRLAPGVRVRSFKVHDDIWSAVTERAETEGVPAASVVRDALIAYLGLPPDTPGVVGRSDR